MYRQHESSWYGCPKLFKGNNDDAFFACHTTIRDLRKFIHKFQSGKTLDKYTDALQAAKRGYLNVLKHLDDKEPSGVIWVYDSLSEYSQYKIITAMDVAAEYGHLHILNWFCETRNQITRYAMDKAAANGYLDVIIYLHKDKRNSVCSSRAAQNAAKHGQLEVIRWLNLNCHKCYCSSNLIIEHAASHGHLEVVKYWFYEHQQRSQKRIIHNAMNLASHAGHQHVVSWLVQNKINK